MISPDAASAVRICLHTRTKISVKGALQGDNATLIGHVGQPFSLVAVFPPVCFRDKLIAVLGRKG